LLPASLQNLAKAFNIGPAEPEAGKLSFNTLDNDTADLNDPNFRDKLLAYNLQDCRVLYEVIKAFNQNFVKLFKMSALKAPTLPSLAYKLFTRNYLKHEACPSEGAGGIELTFAEDYKNYKEAYRGGAVDVYRPWGKDIWCYDINSLYPSVMKSNKYPTGFSEYFKGSVTMLRDVFGIVKCNIIAPDIYAPILLTKTADGRVIAPTGSWTGWYVTEELKLAKKYGYKIKILKGYYWPEKDNIFSGFVSTLYDLRLSFQKSDPRNLICKFIMNTLYGKFGMSPKLIEYLILNKPKVEDTSPLVDQGVSGEADIQAIDKTISETNKIINNITEFKNVLLLEKEKFKNKNTASKNLIEISTPIAMFTTAYARMYMAKFKIKYQSFLYYSDTDSLVLSCPLPEHLVGNEIGQFKAGGIEYMIKEGIFLGAKLYALRLEDNTLIIKIKGFKSDSLNKEDLFSYLKSLLNKDGSKKLYQAKWFKSLLKESITIKDSPYLLQKSENKRNFVYNSDNILVDTLPFKISEDENNLTP